MDHYRAVDFLATQCARLGVTHVFGVDGANIEDFFDALDRTAAAHHTATSGGAPVTVTPVIAKHEFGAAAMADGYARARGGLGVVAATSGGGAMNLVAGLAESFTSRVPVLALVGQPPTALEGNGAFQDTSGRAETIDAARLFGEVTRYCARVERAADLPDHLSRAVSAALEGGPAVLLLPKDVQQARIARAADILLVPRPPADDSLGVAAVVTALAQARCRGKVVVIAGEQVLRNRAARPLRQLAALLDARVGVTPDAKAAYQADEPGYCGVAGIMGHPELVDAVADAALCLLVGTRLPVTSDIPALADTELVSIGALPPYRDAVHARADDLAETLAEVVAAFGGSHRPVGGPAPGMPRPAEGVGGGYRDAMSALATVLTERDDVVADAGNTGAAAVHYLDAGADGLFLIALGMGGMGYGFGAAVGTACARGRRTYLVAGDGAFFMHGMEIHTAVEHRLPITFVVFNNNAHAMCVARERLFYRTSGRRNRFRVSHLAAGIAAMFPSAPAVCVRSGAELVEALCDERTEPGPRFIEVECDPDELPPFTPFTPLENP